MTKPDAFYELPSDLPVPRDDGACDHLVGTALPSLPLLATSGQFVDLAGLPGRTVVYCYPRTGSPGVPVPAGWDAIPGARGCTPQSCAFRDHYQELRALRADVYGLSAQTTDYQREAAERLHLPFALLSDVDLSFARALRLPTFDFDGVTLIKRLTFIVLDGRIEAVFYPVFPPDANAAEVIKWLTQHPMPRKS
jgi:peroxiredoxin